jgi:hypothetical protein
MIPEDVKNIITDFYNGQIITQEEYACLLNNVQVVFLILSNTKTDAINAQLLILLGMLK